MRHALRFLIGLASLAVAAPAVAHVDVLPSEVTVGEAQRFTIRVPTEGEVATTSLRITFPADVIVYSFATPPAGWTVKPVEAGGTYTAAEYRGSPVGPDRFIEFEFLGNPRAVGATSWPVLQRLADGKVKRWTGPPETEGAPETGVDAPGPAAIVNIRDAEAATASAATETTKRTSSSAGIWLGVVAVAFSALAALMTGLLWSSRPAKLPEDEPAT